MYYSNGPSTTYVFSVSNPESGIDMRKRLFRSIVYCAELSLQENSALATHIYKLYQPQVYSDTDPDSNKLLDIDN